MSSPRVTRRQLLVGSVAVAAAGALAPALAGPAARPATARERDLAERVRKGLPGLELDPEGLLAFARDWHQAYPSDGPEPLTQFLLSSDHFPDADPKRTVRYVALFDPYRNPCSNPLRSQP